LAMAELMLRHLIKPARVPGIFTAYHFYPNDLKKNLLALMYTVQKC